MERWYGTLHDQFCRSMPSYVGKDPASKPQGYAKLDTRADAPGWAQTRERIGAYIRAFNASADHQVIDLVDDRGARLSPDQAMTQWCTTLRAFDRVALELLLLHHGRPVTVTKRGVSITVAGTLRHYGMFASELTAYQHTGKRVRPAYDPTDTRTVRVFDDVTNRLICIASENEIGGSAGPVGREKISQFNRQLSARKKALKDVGLGVFAPTVTALEAMHAQGELPERGEPTTETVAPVTTRFDGQDSDLQQHTMKQAVGAEHEPAPRRDPDGPKHRPKREDLLERIDPADRLDDPLPLPTPAPETPEEDLDHHEPEDGPGPIGRIGGPPEVASEDSPEVVPEDADDALVFQIDEFDGTDTDDAPRDLLKDLFDED